MNQDVPVQLDEEGWQRIVTGYINDLFLPESQEVLQESIQAGASLEEAVFDAVRNEAVNRILARRMAIDQVVDAMEALVAQRQEEVVAELPVPQPVRTVFVKFQKEGIHCYPDAATNPNLATGGWDDVSFLASPHRHIFHFLVQLEVFHDDRDVEFIQLKRFCERLYADGTLSLDHKSCEMISDDLHARLVERFPNRKISIEVSEDDENGSVTFYDAQ